MPLCSPQCHLCSVGGPVTCTDCGCPLGCHLEPTPFLCDDCLKKPEERRKGPAPVPEESSPAWTSARKYTPPEWPVGRKPYLEVVEQFNNIQKVVDTLMAVPDETRDTLIGMLEQAEKRLQAQTKLLREAQNNDFRRPWSMRPGPNIDDWVFDHHIEHRYHASFTFIMVKGVVVNVRCNCGAEFKPDKWGRANR